MDVQSNIGTIKSLYTFFNERRWDEITKLYADDTLVLDTQNGTRFLSCNRDEVGKRHISLEERYPGLKEQILYITESGSQVFVQYKTSFKTKAGNVHVEIGWSIYTVEDGKIKMEAPYFSYP